MWDHHVVCALNWSDIYLSGMENNGSAPFMANIAKLTHPHTHKHMCTQNVTLFVPGCENTCSPPPDTHTHTLQHPPQEETTPALPVALMRRSQVPRRSPASFVWTAGRKPSLAWGHRALGTKRECVCACVRATFGVVGVCGGFVQWGHLQLLAGIFPPNSPLRELCRGKDEEKTAITSSSISCQWCIQTWWWDDK